MPVQGSRQTVTVLAIRGEPFVLRALPGLASHEIDALTDRYGQKVFQSYLENQTPAAGRIYWVHGPERRQITIIGIEPHPDDDKRGGYDRVNLSKLPAKD